MAQETAFELWEQYYKDAAGAGSELLYPSETLVRLFKGSYIPDLDRNYIGKKVLEVGFGNGNNLVFLATLGLGIYGVEITEDICTTTVDRLQRCGVAAELRVGTNRELPFDDNTFDFLVSWNVVHYEENEQSIREAIAEYCRVLKPDGRFFLSTTGPDHMILQNSETLSSHRYRIERMDDFRKGQVYFYFDAPNYIDFYFGEKFHDVRVGRTRDFLMTNTQDYWVVTGVK